MNLMNLRNGLPARQCMRTPWMTGEPCTLQPIRVRHLGRSATAAAASADQEFCSPERIGNSLQKQVSAHMVEDASDASHALAAYYKHLGCSEDQIARATASVSQASPPLTAITSEVDSLQWAHQLQVYGYELLAAAVAAALITCVQQRPRGWTRRDLLEARPSDIAGMGLFAAAPIPCGTVLGAYAGRPRSPVEMEAKSQYAPESKQYAFQTNDGRYLDPTDMSGKPSPNPSPGLLWPLDVDISLSYANEPPAGSGGTNVHVQDGPGGPLDLLFVSTRDVQAGEEILIDYGQHYDRSGYAR